jgi:2-keto-myo-inositol isomerase
MKNKFAINHITCPRLTYVQLADLARNLGCVGIQLRNDLGRPLFEGDQPSQVRTAVQQNGLRLLGLAEIKSFNRWSDAKLEESRVHIEIAHHAGADAVGLIPCNDGTRLEEKERLADLELALTELMPLLREKGMRGYVEPLGFRSCSLRLKREAVAMIEKIAGDDCFALVHDTIHHFMAAESDFFPELTGIVEISGVEIPGTVKPCDIPDSERVLVGPKDEIENLEQLRTLLDKGYSGSVSYELFSPIVQSMENIEGALKESIEFVSSSL